MTGMTNPRSPEIFVDTFREGMLAVVGHDLRIEAQRFELRAIAGNLTAKVDLSALRVLGSMVKGRLEPSAPSPNERAEIEQRIRTEVLDSTRNREASLNATVQADGTGFTITGTLVLCGRAQPLRARVTRSADALETSVELVPSHYGIKPFRALGGALRIADKVIVRVRLPLAAIMSDSDLAALTAGWQRP
jgi:hypothetical protein